MSISSKSYIFCEGLKPKKWSKKGKILELFAHDKNKKNLNLNLKEFQKVILESEDSYCLDLINIATYVYITDCQITRGTYRNPYDEDWVRDLNFHIPVTKFEFWNQNKIKEALIRTLEFATGDKYSFEFYKGDIKKKQTRIPINLDDSYKIDCISLMSGGVDSLLSTIELFESGKKPLLISHVSTQKLSNVRKDLLNQLKQLYGRDITNLEVEINNLIKGKKEETQRSRSFLYAVLGATFARSFNVKEVFLSDNGIVSFNLPYSNQNIGTLNSRSTNPRFIYLFNLLIKNIWEDKSPIVKNPLIWQTKADVIKKLKDMNKAYLLTYTSTCAHTRDFSYSEPYCGVCSQCLDRRFAVEWVGINNKEDPRGHYKIDVFNDDLKEGYAKTHAENYFRRANQIDQMNKVEDFLKSYSEILEYGRFEQNFWEFSDNTFKLYKRQAKQILDVIDKKLKPSFHNLRTKKSSKDSLMGIIFRESLVNNIILSPEIETTNKASKIIEIFFSYSHKDELLKNELVKHLGLLRQKKIISCWNDRKIIPGQDFNKEIDAHINTANIILLLVSSDFLDSNYCYGIEMKRALDREKNKEATVIPIILRPCDWEEAPFKYLLAGNIDAKAVTSNSNLDESFTEIAKGIRKAVKGLVK